MTKIISIFLFNAMLASWKWKMKNKNKTDSSIILILEMNTITV